MQQSLNGMRWKLLFEETFAAQGALVDSARGLALIPEINLHTTFALWIPVFTAGNVSVKLRFGFSTNVALASFAGCDSALIAAADLTVLMRQAYSGVAGPGAAPIAGGSPDGILPPVVRVFTSCAAATTLQYQILYSCLYLP